MNIQKIFFNICIQRLVILNWWMFRTSILPFKPFIDATKKYKELFVYVL